MGIIDFLVLVCVTRCTSKKSIGTLKADCEVPPHPTSQTQRLKANNESRCWQLFPSWRRVILWIPRMALACHEQVQEPKTPLGLHDEARTVLSSPHSEVLEGALLGVDVATRKGGERRSAA